MAKARLAPPLTVDRLKEVLSYDPETGEFRWLVAGPKHAIGDRAGGSMKGRYPKVHIDGTSYRAHRLAWFYVHGAWPLEVDHINLEKSDNRMANLRDSDRSKNMANTPLRSTNSSGFKGVVRVNRRWRAQGMWLGKFLHFGYWDTPEEAAAAYEAGAKKIFGEFARAS